MNLSLRCGVVSLIVWAGFSYAGMPSSFSPGVLSETVVFDIAGTSYYDLNANDRLPRLIALNKFRDVAAGWAKGATPDITGSETRNMFATLWLGGATPNFSRLVPANPVGRGGFGGVDWLPRNGKFIIFSNRSFDALPDLKGSYAAIENTAGTFVWTNGDKEYHFPDSSGVPGSDPGMWPAMAGGYAVDVHDLDGDSQTDDTVNVVHSFSVSYGGSILEYVYSRAVETSDNGWTFPGFTGLRGMVVDSGQWISATVVTSKKSAKVALIWTSEHECNFTNSNCIDIYYLESQNGGQEWVDSGGFASFTPINVTNYGPADFVRARPDFSAVYDQNDSLVIAFPQTVNYDPNTGSHSLANDLMVWTKEHGIRKAVNGNFDQIPPGVSLGFSTRKSYLNYPHLSIHDGTANITRKNDYFLVYSQHGGNAFASYTDTSAEGHLNGEVYVSASTNRGLTWSTGLNLTNSKTPACDLTAPNEGNCSDVSFSSVAERCDDTLHFFFMSDSYTGNLVTDFNTSAQGTNNNLLYVKYSFAFIDQDTDTVICVGPGFFPGLNPQDTVLTDTFEIGNCGNADLTVDSIRTDSAWMTINNGANGFIIPEGEPNVPIGFTVSDSGMPDGIYVDTIRIYNNSEGRPVANLTVRMVVDNLQPFVFAQSDTLHNGVVQITVTNFGDLSNQNLGFRYVGGPDTINSQLMEASGFLTVINTDGDTVSGNSVHEQYTSFGISELDGPKDTTLVAPLQKPGSKVKIPPGDYKFASASWAVFRPFDLGVEYPGPWYGFEITDEWWLPDTSNPAWSPKFLLWGQEIKRVAPPSWWPAILAIDSTSQTVYVGTAADWDAFTIVNSSQGHTSSDNFGGVGTGSGVAWVQGSDTTDTYALDSVITQNDHFVFTAWMDSLDNIDPYAMHVVSNPSYLYAGGNYAESFGAYRDDQLYLIASDSGASDTKYFHGDPMEPDFDEQDENWPWEPTDVSVIMTNSVLTPSYPATTFTYNLMGVWFDTLTIVMTAESNYDDPTASCRQMSKAINQARGALGIGQLDSFSVWGKVGCIHEDCLALPGDANASGSYTLADIIATVGFVFNKPGWPACQSNSKSCWLSDLLCRGDWNASGTVTLSDVIQGVNLLFNKPGGPWCPLPSGLCCGFPCP